MKEISYRLKEIREKLGLSRKNIEEESNHEIKATSLSTFENNQSQISISYLKRLVSFYQKKGIHVNYDWLITGIGVSPEESNLIGNGLSLINETEYFKINNTQSIILTVKTNEFTPIIMIGDIIGAIKIAEPVFNAKLCAIKTNDDFLIKIAKKTNSGIIIYNWNPIDVNIINPTNVVDIYQIVYFRGNHGNNQKK